MPEAKCSLVSDQVDEVRGTLSEELERHGLMEHHDALPVLAFDGGALLPSIHLVFVSLAILDEQLDVKQFDPKLELQVH